MKLEAIGDWRRQELSYQKNLKKIHNYKNIFLDRDGIINEVVVRNNEISSPRHVSEFIFRQDFLEFIKIVPLKIEWYLKFLLGRK